jgi:hypothetical protein
MSNLHSTLGAAFLKQSRMNKTIRFNRTKRLKRQSRENQRWIMAWGAILIIAWLGSLFVLGEAYVHAFFTISK